MTPAAQRRKLEIVLWLASRQANTKPSPVRRVEIDKPDGGKRHVGIPTHRVDRVTPTSIAQSLRLFSDPTSQTTALVSGQIEWATSSENRFARH